MGSKTRQIAVGTELGENNANLVTSRKIKTRLARPIDFDVNRKIMTSTDDVTRSKIAI